MQIRARCAARSDQQAFYRPMEQKQKDSRLLSVFKLGLRLVVSYVRWLHLGPVIIFTVAIVSSFLLALGGLALGPIFEVPGAGSLLEPYVGTSMQFDQDDVMRFWKSAWPYVQIGAGVGSVLDETTRRMAGTSPLHMLSQFLGVRGAWPPLQKFLLLLAVAITPFLLLVIALGGFYILPQVTGMAVFFIAPLVGWIVFVDHLANRAHRKIDRMEWGNAM